MLTDDPSAPFILIVEDDDDHAVLLRRSFDSSSEEYRLVTAIHLRDARQVLLEDTPDLVLADYCLPDGGVRIVENGGRGLSGDHNDVPRGRSIGSKSKRGRRFGLCG